MRKRGALDFDAAEAEFVIDSAERVRAIELRSRNDAHRLIEECMILANVAVAQELEKTHTPTLYRVHGTARRARSSSELLSTLTSLGIEAQMPETVTTRDLQAIARRLGNSPERPFVESLVVRSMPQAVYQPTNIGHFGLALTHYAHFTSPIRRYPDLVVHRTLEGADRGTVVAAAGDVRTESVGRAGREHLEAREASGRGGPLRRYVPQVHLFARAHWPDLPRPHHHRGRVWMLRADPGRRGGRSAAPRQLCATTSTRWRTTVRLASGAGRAGGCVPARRSESSSPQ